MNGNRCLVNDHNNQIENNCSIDKDRRKFSFKRTFIFLILLIALFGGLKAVYALADQDIKFRVMLANWEGNNTPGQPTTKRILFELRETDDISFLNDMFFCVQDLSPYQSWNSISPPSVTKIEYAEMSTNKHKWWTVVGGHIV